MLDVGTGSGAIALALADEHPGATVVAVDVSADALALAAANVERTGLAGRVELVQGHLLEPVEGPFDLVVSNPPYVQPEEVGDLAPEIREWEPAEALSGEGLTEAIASAACDVLAPDGDARPRERASCARPRSRTSSGRWATRTSWSRATSAAPTGSSRAGFPRAA